MTDMTLSVAGDIHDRERSLDWLTALFPILLMGIFYYRWAAVALALLATAGYLTAAVLLQWVGLLSCRTAPALVTGLLIAFYLPATAPLWTAAIAGAVAAVVATLPGLVSRRFGGKPYARPLLHPALVGYLFVWLVFPDFLGSFTMPAQWASIDGATAATSLAGLTDPTLAVSRVRLFFGIYAGAVGETCSAVILLAAAYLLLRRRLRLIAPACMLATVSLLSWLVWGSPLYSLLAGATLLSALLLADRTFAPAAYGSQAAAGVFAGVLTVLLRANTGTDGTGVAVLAACLLTPLYPLLGRLTGKVLCRVVAFLKDFLQKIQKRKNNG